MAFCKDRSTIHILDIRISYSEKLDKTVPSTLMLKIKFVRNSATLDVAKGSSKTVIFSPKEILQILVVRSIGYYGIKQGILQPNLSKYFRFESVDVFVII